MAKLKSSARTRGSKSGKTTQSAPEAGLSAKAEQMSRSIVESAQQIWLAGVGAFSRAQEEGTKMFEALVKEGVAIEKSTRKLAGGRVDAVREAMEERVEQARERATDTWDRLEKVFEQRVQRAMGKLGVPSRAEIQALIERVDTLNAELRKLGKAPATRTVAKPAAKKAAKAPARKAGAGKTSAAKSKPAARPARKTARKTTPPAAPGQA